jgi:hypothetical protein
METSTAPAKCKTDIPLRFIGEKGSNPLQILDKLWEFYSQKGIKTVFVSLGTSTSPLAELEIGEILGCPIHIVEPSDSKRELWNTVFEILKSRKRQLTDENTFTQEVENKWVLPKKVRVSNKLPFFFNGSLELSGNVLETLDWNTYIEDICKNMNISPRVDILNIQLGSLEESVLYSFTNTCFRPGLIMISYTNTPDTNLLTTQAAGHLQNIGYQLIGKHENNFLYLYNDKNVYEYASYENKNVENPLLSEILKSVGIL